MFEHIEHTWAADILDQTVTDPETGEKISRYQNIELFAYGPVTEDLRGKTPHRSIGIVDKECNMICVDSNDTLFDTFGMLSTTLRTLMYKIRDVDYILVCSARTYVNIPLLNTFVNFIPDNDMIVWSGRLIAALKMSGPYSYCLYPEGVSTMLIPRMYIPYLTDKRYRTRVALNDHVAVTGEKYWTAYKHDIWDTATGCCINEALLHKGGNYKSDDESEEDVYEPVFIRPEDSVFFEGIVYDHTKLYMSYPVNDYNRIFPGLWRNHIALRIPEETEDDVCRVLREIHENIHEYYTENDYNTDDAMRYISEYLNNPQNPEITMSTDKPDCCLDDAEKLNYDDYHKWLEDNTDVPNLEVNEDGEFVPEGEGTSKTIGKKQTSENTHPTYAEYFNIRFWNHRCWYRNPWTPVCGFGPCGCGGWNCEAEQLVYPGGSPSHDHCHPEDECGCKWTTI